MPVMRVSEYFWWAFGVRLVQEQTLASCPLEKHESEDDGRRRNYAKGSVDPAGQAESSRECNCGKTKAHEAQCKSEPPSICLQ